MCGSAQARNVLERGRAVAAEADLRAGARGRRHGLRRADRRGRAAPADDRPRCPGSGFQGADGDQADARRGSTGTTLQGTGRVEHAPDPNAQDTAFKDGTKEDEPGDWDFVERGRRREAVAGEHPRRLGVRRGARGADTFLSLGFARAAGNGTSYLTFELNRDDRLWDNGLARIPCRRDGDLLITFQPHGNDVTLSVQSWKTASTDPSTGCAQTGSLSDAADVTANVDVQGAMNAAAIANSLPGISGPTIPEAQFGETAIDLDGVLEAVGKHCGAFTSVWMHSRSSTSESSNMQDYVAPHEIDARRCSAAGTKWLDNDADGVRDPGDLGLAGFRIYADLDEERGLRRRRAVRHQRRPRRLGDRRDHVAGRGTRCARSRRATSRCAGAGRCSHPAPACSWTIDAAAEPYARDRDFGNWIPAHVTLDQAARSERRPRPVRPLRGRPASWRARATGIAGRSGCGPGPIPWPRSRPPGRTGRRTTRP